MCHNKTKNKYLTKIMVKITIIILRQFFYDY